MLLTVAEADAVNAEVARAEAATGVEIVAVVALRASHYPQIPWKAFALGVALAALFLVAAGALVPGWGGDPTALRTVVTMLAAGAAFALLTVFAAPFARLFLRRPRSVLEVRRCAEVMFHRHRVGATRECTGVLLLVCLFERRLEVIADAGLAGRVEAQEWRAALDQVPPPAGPRAAAPALIAGVRAIAALLAAKGLAGDGSDRNELPDRPREETGP
jgi:putative membrane protein